MAEADGMIVMVGQYASQDDAFADLDAIRMLKDEKFIGDFEAAVFEKQEGGKVKILDTVSTNRTWGAKAGLISGAVLGVIFPPSIIALGLTGAGVGALVGNIMNGLHRGDVKEMGEALDEGTVGLVFFGEDTTEEGVERLLKKAAKLQKKMVDAEADAMKQSIDDAVDEATG
jgi:uncharacterized membrane protein